MRCGEVRRRAPMLVAALLAMLVCGMPIAAQARVVGIVFDDSGSMRQQIHTPTFGVQILASTLDGRPGSDRLLTLRLSEIERHLGGSLASASINDAVVAQILSRMGGASLGELPIATSQLQGTVDHIRRNFATPRNATPYVAIEVMLAALTQALHPGEAGYLVILTDGRFEPDPPGAARLREAYERYKAQLTAKAARLTVDFLAMGLRQAPSLFDDIDKQCVRPLLLGVFNGNSDSPVLTCDEPRIRSLPGYHNVKTIEELITALEGIVSEISGTVRRLDPRFVQIDGATVTIDTPLSISRMVTIATATAPQTPPSVQKPNFPVSWSSATIALAMDRADDAAPDVRQKGVTTQYIFGPRALAAGTHRLAFDRPAQHNLQLIFQTAATLDLDVVGPDGKPVPRDAEGHAVIPTDTPHRLLATIVDETPQGRGIVPLNSLRAPVAFTATLEVGARRQPVTLARDGTSDRAIGEFSLTDAGNAVASAEAAIEGFLTLSSPTLRIAAQDRRLSFDTAVRSIERCPDCPANVVLTTFGPRAEPADVAEITITPHGKMAGHAALDRSGVPSWLTLTDDAGQLLADGAAIEVKPGTPIRIRLRREARSCADITGTTERFSLVLKPTAPLTGEARVDGDVRLAAPPAQLSFARPSGSTDDQGRLVSSAFALARGEGALVFALEGSCAPPHPDEFAATPTATAFTGARVRTTGQQIEVTPRLGWWCACLAFIDGGTHTMTVAFRGPGGLQASSAEADFVVAPTLREHLTCIAMLLIAIWLAFAVLVALRAERFPRGSVIEIREGNQIPRYVDLRDRNWTFVKALFWPLRRLLFGKMLPHEHRGVEGLKLMARRGGLIAQVDRDTTDFELRGQHLSEMLETNPKLSELRINWREEIEFPGKPRVSIRFLRSMADATM